MESNADRLRDSLVDVENKKHVTFTCALIISSGLFDNKFLVVYSSLNVYNFFKMDASLEKLLQNDGKLFQPG